MFTVNLNKEQAMRLLSSALTGEKLDRDVADEVVRQVQHQAHPAPTDAAETSVWFYESGALNRRIEEWRDRQAVKA